MTEIQKGSRVRVTLEATLVGDYRNHAASRPDLYVKHDGGTYALVGVTDVELVAPPKPEEPTGLGAVVEDAAGDRWVRSHTAHVDPWTRPHLSGTYAYDAIDAVRVLSEGVTRLMCTHTLWNGLACLRTDVHTTGHIYGSSWAPDRHDLTEAVSA